MANGTTSRQLPDLLREPREALDLELKGWLDLRDNQHRAVLAKAMIALANHGGGFIVIGFEEQPNGSAPAEGRPSSLAMYTPDSINSIVSRYIEPAFHCDLHLVVSPNDSQKYPIITVPGGHTFPIRSKRSSPDGRTLVANLYYIRRPGPQSEAPQSGREWDQLIRRCIANDRTDLFDQFRLLMAGGVPEISNEQNESDKLSEWFDSSVARWDDLKSALLHDHVGRLSHGHWATAYQLFNDQLEPRNGVQLLKLLREGVVRHTGWPPFWIPTRDEIAPYIHDGIVECWIGRHSHIADAAHADYWRVSPRGQFFLLRGLQEDSFDAERVRPGTAFDLTLPVWRIGEILLHTTSMAQQFEVPDATVRLITEWSGLAGRTLQSIANRNRNVREGRRAHQDLYKAELVFQASNAPEHLPELVTKLLRPLYELFDFFQPPSSLVTEELARMRGNRFTG